MLSRAALAEINENSKDTFRRVRFGTHSAIFTQPATSAYHYRYMVMVKLRPKLSVVNNLRYRRPPLYNLERLKQPDVTTAYT